MHFKHFWVPCLHIIFFTSRLECSRKPNEKMKWNSGIPAEASQPAAAGIPVRSDGGIPCRISKQSIRTNGAQDFHSCDWRVSSDMRGNFEPHLIRMKKSSYQTWLESIDQKCVLFGSNVVFQKGAKWSKYRFFMLLLLRILVGNIFYMLSDSNLLKNILIRQISSHRCAARSRAIKLRLYLALGRMSPEGAGSLQLSSVLSYTPRRF